MTSEGECQGVEKSRKYISVDSPLIGPLSVSDLLQFKRLEPLDASGKKEVERIASLDVAGYSEADVREEIVSPLLRVLGYDKQSYFSVDREKPIKLLGRNKFLDYSLTLWSENFWLIETKKPKGKGFSYSDLRQAVEYAVHPEINASLVMLCNGRLIEVYDREISLTDAIVRIEVKALTQEIDKLRAILSPWQLWFFEKRRIVRYIDKVFDKEFNEQRVEEFRSLVSRRLDKKRSIILENFRQIVPVTGDAETQFQKIRSASLEDIVEVYFFIPQSVRASHEMAETLRKHCKKDCFWVLVRMLRDEARDMNDHYCAHTLNFLMHLYDTGGDVSWLPAWLGSGRNLSQAIQNYIRLTLTHFGEDPLRRNVLLAAAALRRLFKAAMVIDERIWQEGEIMHVLDRYVLPEDCFAQMLSSPSRNNLIRLDGRTQFGVTKMLRECSDEKGKPQDRLLELRLRQLWKAELEMLESTPNYMELVKQRDLGEIFPTEMVDVIYDNLGHEALCYIELFPKWKEYTMKHHHREVDALAKMGSWQARKWLEYDKDFWPPRPSDKELANRFFLGDQETFRRLNTAYGFI